MTCDELTRDIPSLVSFLVLVLRGLRGTPAPIGVVVIDVLVHPYGIAWAPLTHRAIRGDVVGQLEDDVDELEPVNEPVGDRIETDSCSDERSRDCRRVVGVSAVVGGECHRSRDVVLVA